MTEPLGAVKSAGSLDKFPTLWEITTDSRESVKGKIFVCIHGRRHDGHEDAAEALRRGAAAIITERPLGLSREVTVPDTREALSYLAARHFGNPAGSLCLIGVTGTNGKTTTAHMLFHILRAAGIPTGLIGTTGIQYGGKCLPNPHTTPEPVALHRIFAEMKAAGITTVVMEVSSQALDQRRCAGLIFEAAVFLNLTPEHLDYHSSMEDYFNAKMRLFAQCRQAVINVDDPYGRRLMGRISCPGKGFSLPRQCSFSVGRSAALWRGAPFVIPFTGAFSLCDALAAAETAVALGIPPESVRTALRSCPPIRGRMELLFAGQRRMILCDYAHTPDAMEKVLSGLRNLHFGRIIVLFGCGGDRDAAKRPLMGKIAARWADRVILTDDNPRSEEPLAILMAIAAGIPEGYRYTIIPDRRQAILRAIRSLREEDLLLLAGKGHETYQIQKDRTVPFDEKAIVCEILERENIPWKK